MKHNNGEHTPSTESCDAIIDTTNIQQENCQLKLKIETDLE
jgi:hypothetical protein